MLKDWVEYEERVLGHIGNNNSVFECAFWYDENYETFRAPEYGKWYRSKYRKELDRLPFTSYLMNKKWSMEEKFARHMLRFQQVTVSLNQFS